MSVKRQAGGWEGTEGHVWREVDTGAGIGVGKVHDWNSIRDILY